MATTTLSNEEILEAIGNKTVVELAELIEAFKSKFNVTIAAAAILLSLVFGTLLAIARINRFPLIRYPAALYIEIVRALPVLFLIFFTYFGGARGITILGLKLSWEDPVAAAIIALTAYTSAVNAEIIRAGILSIERGQLEAARALVKEAEDAELFLYPGNQHYFADSTLPSYDAKATALLTRRVLEFLAATSREVRH